MDILLKLCTLPSSWALLSTEHSILRNTDSWLLIWIIF